MRRGSLLAILFARGRPQPRFFQVDDDFTTLRWSWTDSLLISEITSVSHNEGGSASFTIHYHDVALASSLPIACRSSKEAAWWVWVLGMLQQLDVTRHGLDAHQRQRLKRAFYASSANAASLTEAQQISFFAHLNYEVSPTRLVELAGQVVHRTAAVTRHCVPLRAVVRRGEPMHVAIDVYI